ncbi:polysaccharide pyruvyl transferase family protein [Parabacteroides merdae]|uniref:polysaccharide pyruvyl transferase family protein n=1 Tax=Parabacteroides merdae TaxID=46503 RepID=UPI001BAC6C9B|nr:polysaccharide pyruvyl transferase family protein [Parabacteroides merdae]QUT47994.1 Polysaccharide pyruvyl transferase [Parabacteroides merdae]
MTKIYIHSNGSAENHGCEAIVRATATMLQKFKYIDYSTYNLDKDIRYGINQIVNCVECKRKPVPKYRSLFYYGNRLLNMIYPIRGYKAIVGDIVAKSKGCDVALSVGGDNYCYKNSYQYLAYLNKELKRRGVYSILWGASIEPSLLENKSVKEDLQRYDALFIRESLSRDALYAAGIKKNIYFYPDPAFTLLREEYKLPDLFEEGNTIGINISPLIQLLEKGDNITYKNYQVLIEYILSSTNYKVALIPHVVVNGNDDRVVLRQLLNEFVASKRVILIDDANCMQIKDCIARCRFFIGARTHATIAAYSTLVPTLVVGYSVKAKGIAKDLFGTYDNYVVPVQSLKHPDDLTKAFVWLQDNEITIKARLESVIPTMVEQSKESGKQLLKIIDSI